MLEIAPGRRGGGRLIALAIAELISPYPTSAPARPAPDSQPASLPRKAEVPAPRSTPKNPAPSNTPKDLEWRLGLSGSLIRLTRAGVFLFGGGLAAALRWPKGFYLELELMMTAGERAVSVGDVGVVLSGGRVAAGWSLSLGKRTTLEGTVGLRAGVVFLSSRAKDPSVVQAHDATRPLLGPLASLGARVAVGSRAGVFLRAEGGVMLLETEGRVVEKPELDLAGPWAAVAAGVDVSF